MPAALLFPIALRAAGPVAFMLAAIVAGVMNTSVLLVPLLALAATLTTILIKYLSPSPALNLAAMLDPNAPQTRPSPFAGMGQRFGIGLIGYAVLFGLAALIAALFQETQFEQTLRPNTFWLLVVPSLIAVATAFLAARMGMSQMAGMAGQMQAMFSQMQAGQNTAADPADPDAFTVEGEIIDEDDRS